MLTNSNKKVANYPFSTIDPNISIVNVPDKRLEILSKISLSKKIVHTNIKFVDIAGILKGASLGEGLGNKFLSHIREVDAVIHVVRCFRNKDIVHVFNNIDPINDINTINSELILADIDFLEKNIQSLERRFNKLDKNIVERKISFYHKLLSHLYDDNFVIDLHSLSKNEKEWTKELSLLTNKPLIYLLNIDRSNIENEDIVLKQTKKIIQEKNKKFIKICVDLETEIMRSSSLRKTYLHSASYENPLDLIVSAAYKLLNLHTYFTVGPKEAKAWTIPKGLNALKSSSKIHSDIERGFIKASIVSYKDYVDFCGYKGAKTHGKLRLESKDYIIEDGDIVHFHFNV